MAVGTPVVATSAGAVPEVVGDAARLVPAGDVDELSAALAEVLIDVDLRARMVSSGFDRVQRFPWKRTVDGLLAAYDLVRGSRTTT